MKQTITFKAHCESVFGTPGVLDPESSDDEELQQHRAERNAI
jgi:hypothetical protein